MIQEQARDGETKGMFARSNYQETLTQAIKDALKKRAWLRSNNRVQADSHFGKVIASTPKFIVSKDVKGHVLYCNRAVRQMLGMSDDEDHAQLHIADIYSARSCATILGEGVISASQEGEWSGEAALVTRVGQEIPVSQLIIAPSKGKPCQFFALIGRDVQDIKQAEESLRESEQFYRRIAETVRIGMWVIDTENQTRFVNPQLAHMLGYSEAEMLGKPVSSFVRCNKIVFSQLDLDNSHELLLRRKNGAELWVSLSPSALYNEQEQYAGTLAVVTEIT